MTKRNDKHAPSTFDPAKYDYRGTVDLTMPREINDLMIFAPEAAAQYRAMWLEEIEALKTRVREGGFKGNFVSKGTCDHCGAWFGYGAEYRHESGEVIVVGHTCAANDFSYDSRASRDKARAVKLRSTRVKTVRARIEANFFIEKHALGAVFSEKTMKHDSRGGRILEEMYGKLVQWGSISDKQIAFARKLADEILNPAPVSCEFCGDAGHAVRGCPNKHNLPTHGDRVEVKAVITFAKWEVGFDGGDRAVANFLTEDGFTLWGTVPAALLRDTDDINSLRGRAVSFAARIKPSRDDSTHGYPSRPSKASYIDRSEVVFNPLRRTGLCDADLTEALKAAR